MITAITNLLLINAIITMIFLSGFIDEIDAAKEFHVSPPTFRKYVQGVIEKVRNCTDNNNIEIEENDIENGRN